MKTKSLTLLPAGIAAATLIALSVGVAQANAIVGQIGFSGEVEFDTGNIETATAITGFLDETVIGRSGAYLPIPKFTPATFTPFVFNPASLPVSPLWEVIYDGVTYSFDLTSVVIDEQDTDSLVLKGTGTLQIAGGLTSYDPTPGTWVLSANNSGGSINFYSADSTAVPDNGATVMLLGASLVGLGVARRRLS